MQGRIGFLLIPFLCSRCNITQIVSTVNRRVLIFLAISFITLYRPVVRRERRLKQPLTYDRIGKNRENVRNEGGDYD